MTSATSLEAAAAALAPGFSGDLLLPSSVGYPEHPPGTVSPGPAPGGA
jgi:hypothetical protein